MDTRATLWRAVNFVAPRMADHGLHARFMMDVTSMQDALPYFADWRLTEEMPDDGHPI